MKVVVAADSFKESLSAAAVARALAGGVLDACGDAEVDICPMADGGEGTVAAMAAATDGEFRTAEVFGPLNESLTASFAMMGARAGRKIAVIEMAAASGMAIVPARRRNPMHTTTFGTGQLILAALDAGAGEIIIGIGGSATIDGGCGCAQALGVVFTDRRGKALRCGLAGGGLDSVAGVDISGRDPRLGDARLRVACDVTNPLTGPDGAAAIYGPQKGATDQMVRQLDAGLTHLAGIIRRDLHLDVEGLPGAGAAGGLVAGLVAFAGATLERGAELIAEAVGLEHRLSGADLCITGEGRLDQQSRRGKTACGVAAVAAGLGVPVICIPGQAAENAPREMFTSVHPLVSGGVTAEEAMRNGEALLKLRAAAAVREFLVSESP